MATFKIYNCDVGFKYKGTDYQFTDVNSVAFENPTRNRLTRGSNGKNETGLSYTEGIREPKRATIAGMNIPIAMYNVFGDIFRKKERIDFYAIDRTDGSSKWLKEAILSNEPEQLNLDDTPESLEVSIELESFQSIEIHKS